jgi:hypothetical protein
MNIQQIPQPGASSATLSYHCYIDARFIWGLIQITFNIPPPLDEQHMFNIWLKQDGKGGFEKTTTCNNIGFLLGNLA